MSMKASAMVYLHAASPLHVGTGQSLDVIDLPIQRERGTGLPVVAGSAVKGVLRAECEGSDKPDHSLINSIFGDAKDAGSGAGAVTFGDARLLLFPVRSIRLLFAWVTCPYVLRRYARDREASGLSVTDELAALAAFGKLGGKAACAHASILVGGKVFLEDADIVAAVDPAVATLAGVLAGRCLPETLRPLLTERLVIVDDNHFGTISRQCTEITARVGLDATTKTVKKGALWYEEALPAETVLYAAVLAEKSRVKGQAFDGSAQITHLKGVAASAQFGGKASVGRGLCNLAWEVKA